MSANNFIFIRQEGKDWIISIRDADTGNPLNKAQKLSNLEDACRLAQDISVDVEYGISFYFEPKG